MDKSIEDMSFRGSEIYARALRHEALRVLRTFRHTAALPAALGDWRQEARTIRHRLMRKCYELERENERLRDCIDTLDRQNDELKALLKGEGVVQ